MFMSGVYRVPDGLLGCGGEAGERQSTPPAPSHPDRDIRLLLRLADAKLSAERIVAEAVQFVASGEAKALALQSTRTIALRVHRIISAALYRWRKKLQRAREAFAEDVQDEGRMMRYVGTRGRRRTRTKSPDGVNEPEFEDSDDDFDDGSSAKLASLEKQLDTLRKQMMMMAEAQKLGQQMAGFDFSDEDDDDGEGFETPIVSPRKVRSRKPSAPPVAPPAPPPPPPPPVAPVAPPAPIIISRPKSASVSSRVEPPAATSTDETPMITAEALRDVYLKLKRRPSTQDDDGDSEEENPGAVSEQSNLNLERPPLRTRSATEGSKPTKQMSFAEQIKMSQKNMRKTEVARSPGGTPLRRNRREQVDDSFHQEMLANALFKKFQKARNDSPRRSEGRVLPSKSAPSTTRRFGEKGSARVGLSSMFDDDSDDSDDDWDESGDKENGIAINAM